MQQIILKYVTDFNLRGANSMQNPYPADHDFVRFQPILLVDQITVIGNEMCPETSRLAIV